MSVDRIGIEFKPALWKRVLESSSLGSMTTDLQIGGGTNVIEDIRSKRFSSEFIARALIRTFLLNISMYIAMEVMDITKLDKIILGEDDIKMLPENKRYGKIVLLLLVFVCIVALVYHGMQYVAYGLILAYTAFTTPSGVDESLLAKSRWTSFWSTFLTNDGPGNMSLYDTIYAHALYGLLIFIIIYALFVQSYLNRIDYPDFIRDEDHNNDEDERSFARKFLTHHSILVTFFVIISVSFVVIVYEPTPSVMQMLTKIMLLYILFIYCIMFVLIMKLSLRKLTVEMFAFASLLLVFTVMMYVFKEYVGAAMATACLILVIVAMKIKRF